VVLTPESTMKAEEPGRGNQKRPQILAAAQEIFAEQGFEAARMDDVARRARVSKGTLYNYFDSKEDLLIHAVIAAMEEWRDRIAAAVNPNEQQPVRAVEEVLRALIVDAIPGITSQYHSLRNQAWGVMARNPEARQRLFDANQAFYRDREQEFETAVEAGARAGDFRSDLDPAEVSLLLQAVFDGLLYRATFDRQRVDPSRAFAALMQLLRGGLYNASDAVTEGEV
jgi:AcrR family transcriptional regulator